ncbi:MAG TPA: methyltransferase domain-containing protein [Polyangiaceae bacterium]|nr:methyltransferase domain-containing protein [Polyangiaceae bacterium]
MLLWSARTMAYHAARNALARVSPRTYSAVQRLTRDSGRGDGCGGEAAAKYFRAVMEDYRVIAEASGVGDAFAGKRVLELGPGDTRAIALLAKRAGARSWDGFDAFDIQSRDERYLDAIYRPLVGDDITRLLDGCMMHASEEALRGRAPFDVVISRAVLEHVRDLDGLFRVLASVVRDDAVLVHKVDLRSHGVERAHALDFLRFGDAAWRAMSSHVDLPNRERASRYLELAERVGLRTIWARTTHIIGREDAERAAPSLAPRFRGVSPDELRVLGLWLVQVGAKHPLASRPIEPLGPAPHDRLSTY